HGRDPGGLGVGGAAEPAQVAADPHLALVDRVDAGERLDERRLPGAVLTHEGVDLPGEQAEVDAVERLDPREGDRDACHLDNRWCGHRVPLRSVFDLWCRGRRAEAAGRPAGQGAVLRGGGGPVLRRGPGRGASPRPGRCRGRWAGAQYLRSGSASSAASGETKVVLSIWM